MLNCCIWDMKYEKNKNEVLIDLEISDNDTILENYCIRLDLSKMGLNKNDIFEKELCEEIRKFINCYNKNNHRLPTDIEIKENLESVNWLETKEYFDSNWGYCDYKFESEE